MAAIWAAGIGAASGIVGDVMSQQGASAANQANLDIAMGNNEFNASEASKNRAFQSDQAVKARTWETQMSDTAMQRRVADLKASGLNPMLAIGQGGASTPNSPAMSGSAASASNVAPMQNPNAAYSQLGNQVTSAIQASTVQSQIDKNRADATASLASAGRDAGNTLKPGEFSALIKSQLQQNVSNASQANQTVLNLQESVKQIDAQIKKIEADTTGQNISNQYAPQINQLGIALQGIQKQLQTLQIPKAQLEADTSSAADKAFRDTFPPKGSSGPSWTDSTGSYIGNKAADLHDWVSDQLGKINSWWQQLHAPDRHNLSSY